MKVCPSPWPEVILYVSGMLFFIFGIGSMIVSINPKPFDPSTWKTFLNVGMGFLVIGTVLIGLTAAIPTSPGVSINIRSFRSAVDLLDDVQSVGELDSPIVRMREAGRRATEESIRTIKSCMMIKDSQGGSGSIVFYKETIV